LPQGKNRAPQSLLNLCSFLLRQSFPVTRIENTSHRHLVRHGTLALNFGRVRGENGTDQGGVEKRAQSAWIDAGIDHSGDGVPQSSGTRRGLGQAVCAVASDTMLVLRDIGEMGKMAKRSHDTDRLRWRKIIQQVRELAPGAFAAVPVKSDRSRTDLLNDAKYLRSLLLANRFAKQATKCANVFAERGILSKLIRIGTAWNSPGGSCHGSSDQTSKAITLAFCALNRVERRGDNSLEPARGREKSDGICAIARFSSWEEEGRNGM
jgi:hypothetical protein